MTPQKRRLSCQDIAQILKTCFQVRPILVKRHPVGEFELHLFTETYSKPCQRSKFDLFADIFND